MIVQGNYIELPGFEAAYDRHEGETMHRVVPTTGSSYYYLYADDLMIAMVKQYLANRGDAPEREQFLSRLAEIVP